MNQSCIDDLRRRGISEEGLAKVKIWLDFDNVNFERARSALVAIFCPITLIAFVLGFVWSVFFFVSLVLAILTTVMAILFSQKLADKIVTNLGNAVMNHMQSNSNDWKAFCGHADICGKDNQKV